MPERPDLTKEAFLVLAEQAGFRRDDPHLDELFPEVQGLLRRVASLDEVDVSGLEPAPHYSAGEAPES